MKILVFLLGQKEFFTLVSLATLKIEGVMSSNKKRKLQDNLRHSAKRTKTSTNMNDTANWINEVVQDTMHVRLGKDIAIVIHEYSKGEFRQCKFCKDEIDGSKENIVCPDAYNEYCTYFTFLDSDDD